MTLLDKSSQSSETLSEREKIDYLHENDFLLPAFLKSDFFFLELLKKTTQENITFTYALEEEEQSHVLTFRQKILGKPFHYKLYLDLNTYLIQKISQTTHIKGGYEKITYEISNTIYNKY